VGGFGMDAAISPCLRMGAFMGMGLACAGGEPSPNTSPQAQAGGYCGSPHRNPERMPQCPHLLQPPHVLPQPSAPISFL